MRAKTAAALVVASTVALLSVTAASGKPPGPPGPPMNVACSQQALVDAIDAANSAGGGTLNLAHRCHYLLTTSPDDSENGLPPITASITINGNQATVDGTDSFRDFEVDGPGSLSARDLTITGGSVEDFGGGIANISGTVSLDHTQVIGNSAGSGGGGIANANFSPGTVATLTVRNSSVSDNQQTSDDPDTALGGGGIANVDATATLDHTQVNGNSAQGFGGGGIATGDYLGVGAETVLTADHSQVNGNTAPNAGGGGGIQNAAGSLTLDHTQVDGNTSLNGGGIASGNQGNPEATAELHVNHSEVDGNTATATPGGEGPPIVAGGIANGGDAVIDHSKVDDNMAPGGAGAGIVNHATMTVNHSEVNGNVAAATMAGWGGGILNAQGPPGTGGTGTLTLDHTKVDDNSAGANGGGIANGFGAMLPGGDVTLKHSEVRRNRAAHGGGIFNNGGTVTLSMGTKVTDNQPDNCEPTNTIAGCLN